VDKIKVALYAITIILLSFLYYDLRNILISNNKIQKEFVKYKSGEAAAKTVEVDYNKIKNLMKESFSKEMASEIKRQGEKINFLTKTIAKLQTSIKDGVGASISEDKIWYSDDRVDIFAHKEGSDWYWDYTVRQSVEVALLGTEQKDDSLRFRIGVKDKLTGKNLKVKEFNAYIAKPKFNFGLYTGIEISNKNVSGIFGFRFNKYSIYGRMSSTDKAVGFVRHFNFNF